MKIIEKKITIKELEAMAQEIFVNLVKAVVDIEKKIMAINGELHADEEALLIERGSKQQNLWGINIYPGLKDSDNFIEFDSMINLRPSQNNRSRSVEDIGIQKRIRKIVNKLIIK